MVQKSIDIFPFSKSAKNQSTNLCDKNWDFVRKLENYFRKSSLRTKLRHHHHQLLAQHDHVVRRAVEVYDLLRVVQIRGSHWKRKVSQLEDAIG